MQPSIFQRYDDDILIGATVVASPSPMASYSADTLLTHRPADRVRWDSGSPDGTTVELVFTLGAGMGSPPTNRADLLVVPCWNVDGGGSPAIVRLTCDGGMDVAIPVPAMMPSKTPSAVFMMPVGMIDQSIVTSCFQSTTGGGGAAGVGTG